MLDRKKALAALAIAGRGGVHYQMFFKNLESADWINLLIQKRMFAHPPKPIREGNSISFPFWPATKYLVRISKKGDSPSLVWRAIKDIETENVRVHEDLAEIAMHLPLRYSVMIAKRAIAWAKSPFQMLLPEMLLRLIERLANEGKVVIALEVLKELISVPNGKGEFDVTERPNGQIVHRRFQFMQHGNRLHKAAMAAARAGGLKALKILCDALEKAVGKKSEASSIGYDVTVFWRTTIQGSGAGHSHSVENELISLVRDGALEIISSGRANPGAVCGAVHKYPSYIFRRLEFYLASQFAEAVPKRVEKLLLDRAALHSPWLRMEYHSLATKGGNVLSEGARKKIFSLIDQGPDLTKRIERAEKKGHVVTDEHKAEEIGIWQRDRLKPFESIFSEVEKIKFETLTKKYGETGGPRPAVSHEVVMGDRAPKSVDELIAMEVPELANYLKTWKEDGGWKSPTENGLSRALVEAVKKSPDRFAIHAGTFVGLSPNYVEALIRGFAGAMEKSNEFAWGAVLDLGFWSISQQDEEREEKESHRYEANWRDVRIALTSLIDSGFSEGSGRFHFSLREKIWSILSVLTSDLEPTVDYEKESLDDNGDAATLALNTVRARAIHSTVAYAYWVFEERKLGMRSGLSEVPEANEVLSKHVDPKNDLSLAVHSVYAHDLNLISWMDLSWIENNFEIMFPKDPNLVSYREVAWESYIAFAKPDETLFGLFKPLYVEAVKKCSEPSKVSVGLVNDNREQLGVHVITRYWHGDIGLEEGGILDLFFSNAPERVRQQTLWIVGHSLNNLSEEYLKNDNFDDVPPRLVKLWEYRIAAISSKLNEMKDELGTFGLWFYSGKFETKWSLAELERIAKLGVTIDGLDQVIEKLILLLDSEMAACMRCVNAIIAGMNEPWGILAVRDELLKFCQKALAVGTKDAVANTKEVIDLLARRGHVEFGELLKNGPS